MIFMQIYGYLPEITSTYRAEFSIGKHSNFVNMKNFKYQDKYRQFKGRGCSRGGAVHLTL